MYKHRRIIVSVIAGLLALLLVGGLILQAAAESSSTIKSRIEGLKQQEEEIAAQKNAVKVQREQNESDLMDLVEQKDQIDQQMGLTFESIETKNELIQEYTLLIAEKQNELGDAITERDALNERFRARIRAMEEKGNLTYWSILFKASAFSDLLDRVEMINEIAQSDARMIEQLQEAAQQIEVARQELAAEKVELQEAREALSAEEEELETQRAEADKLMTELMTDHEKYVAAENEYQQKEAALLAQIAEDEEKYKEALAAEEEARKMYASGSSSNYGFIWPCDARAITSPFGTRIDPITGETTSHSGIDIAAAYGAPVYACASGVVTAATYSSIFGYHVRIGHGNGFLTLYGHMISYTVQEGQYVERGQVIGYVGSTGKSTGPHLHLTMYYNNVQVNPLSYLPAGGYFT